MKQNPPESPHPPGPSYSDGKRSGIVIPKHLSLWQRILAYLIYLIIRLYSATIRFKLHPQYNHTEVFNPDTPPKPVIFCIWHNRLFLCLSCYNKFARKPQPTRRMVGITSASHDGGMVSKVLEHFQVDSVRGSSHRRGGQALVEMHTFAQKGYDLAVTPDGPRGPRYHIHPGVITLAQITGLPILPITYTLSRKYTLKSWDKFQIPIPFCTCTVSAGEPIYIPRYLKDDEREQWRQKVNQIMLNQTQD